MNESVILRGKSGKLRKTSIAGIVLGLLLSVGGFVAYILIFEHLDATVGNAAARATTPAFIGIMLLGGLLLIVCIIFYLAMGRCVLTVTDTAVSGRAAFGKRVEIPVLSIRAVRAGSFGAVVVETASAAAKFYGMDDRDAICSQLRQLKARATAGAERPQNWEAILEAVKTAVCAQLKSPASAQFPPDLVTFAGDAAGGYRVEGYVDSQNGYGAMIRNDFSADVVLENGAPVVRSATVAAGTNRVRAKNFVVMYVAISVFVVVFGAILYFLISSLVGL